MTTNLSTVTIDFLATVEPLTFTVDQAADLYAALREVLAERAEELHELVDSVTDDDDQHAALFDDLDLRLRFGRPRSL